MPDAETGQDAFRDQIHQRFHYLKSFFQERYVEHQLFGLIDRNTHRDSKIDQSHVTLLREKFSALEPKLGTEAPANLAREFADLTLHIQKLSEDILELSERLQPGELRNFLEQFPSFDEDNLVFLAKFYIGKDPKQGSDFDIVDLILTRLGTQSASSGNGKLEKRPIEDLLRVVGKLLPPYRPSPEEAREVDAASQHLRQLTAQLSDLNVRNLQELYDHRVIDEVRKFKRSLGPLFFAPPVLLEIIDYNVSVRGLIHNLYQTELGAVESQVLQLRVMLRTLEHQAESDPKTAAQFVQYAEEVEQAFEHAREKVDINEFKPAEIQKSLERAFAAYGNVTGAEAGAGGNAGAGAGAEAVAGAGAVAVASTTSEDFVISDEVSGASIETTESYVEAIRSIADPAKSAEERGPLAFELAPLVATLDPWEVEAFHVGGDAAVACIRAMVALRLKIVRFDAWRRREVGREAAMKVSTAYLLEVAEVEDEAQTVINDLIKGAKLDDMRKMSNSRSKLLVAAREVRTFVEEVKMELAGEAKPDTGFYSSAGSVVSGSDVVLSAGVVGPGIDAPMPAPGESWSGIHFPVPKAKPKPKGKAARPQSAAERAAQKSSTKKLVTFFLSLIVFVGVSLYLILDDRIGSRYKGQVPDFAEFDVSQFSGILAVKSAKKIRDAVEIVVKPDWPQLSKDKKREKVGTLFNVLRPSGVTQLFVFDDNRRMVASCLNGAVTVIQ
ncbi:MAG: hypothetical protein HYY84_05670 [Deltaproteobacteria bacterium]|nr:hypothetical protein [Deltaproteobacteria bacterium]